MRRVDLPCIRPSFIGAWHLEQPQLCHEIIDLFERNHSMQKAGRVNAGVNVAAKNSMDLTIYPNDLLIPAYSALVTYIKELHACYRDYLQQWPFLARTLTDIDIGEFNIQKYVPGGHFSYIHSERTSLDTLHRVLVWMTYLNDVDDGGHTNFLHYELDIKPECGKTLIWPAEWTHAHSGLVVNSGTKYIITGWMHFPIKMQVTERNL